MIHTFKYQNRRAVGRVLGGWMAGTYGRIPEIRGMDAVVPVPLHPRRLRQRGFNQAEILAHRVCECAGIPLENALERVRHTQPQWRLSRGKRSNNLARAIRASPGVSLRGKNCLLIDDICTTGRTLEECARALKSAGAARVCAYVLARD
ncbi:MAG: ComF family protein [Elusimicrobia bacterium]|nr:ComF family protein [Elusimicrobiota bacterium]